MKHRIVFLLMLLLPMTAVAQNKPLTAQDLISGGRNYFRFVPKTLRQLSFVGDKYVYRQGDTLLLTAPASRKHTVWVTLADLNAALEKRGMKALRTLPAFSVEESDGTPRLCFTAQAAAG